jgi:hypothetical protein
MYVLVTRERGRPDFLTAIHWNWPSNIAIYLLGGFTLSLACKDWPIFADSQRAADRQLFPHARRSLGAQAS